MPDDDYHLTCPRGGALLYGIRCARCDCERTRDVMPVGRVTGFDPGGDRTATIRMTKVSDYEFSVEDIERAAGRTAQEFAEYCRWHREQVEERIRRSVDPRFWTVDPPWGEATTQQRGRADGRSRRIGDHDVDALTQRCRECGIDLRVMAEGRSARCGQELIVDPADRRGFDAAPARLARSAPMP